MRSGVGGVKNHDSKTLQFRPVFLESGELSSQERGLKRTQTDSEGKGLFSFLTFALCQFCSISFRVQVGRVFFFFFFLGLWDARPPLSLCRGTFHSYLEKALFPGNNTFARDVPNGLTLPGFPATLGPFLLRRHGHRLRSAASHLGIQAGSARSSELSKMFPVFFCPVSASRAATPGAENLRRAGRTGLVAMPAER